MRGYKEEIMYKKGSQGWLKHWDFILLDVLCLHMAGVLAYMIRNGFQNPYADSTFIRLSIVFVLVDLVVILFCGPLKNVTKRNRYQEFAKTVKHVCLVALLVTFYLFSTHDGEQYSRIMFYLIGIFYGVMSYLARVVWKRLLRVRSASSGNRSLFLVTNSAGAEPVLKNLEQTCSGLFRIVGLAIVDEDLRGKAICGIPVTATRDDIMDYLKGEWIDEVYISLPREEAYPDKLVSELMEMGTVLHVDLLHLPAMEGQKQFIERIGSSMVLTMSLNYATPSQAFLKRAVDIAGGLVGCLITGILCIFIGPLIYIQSPGPIFFSQIRVGRNGKKFKMYKFRSMYPDAEEHKQELMEQNNVKDGMMFKLEWDPRIIGTKRLPDGRMKKGIGNYIRDWSLDEFPQFYNVLKGDMSLVGTRPPTVDEWEKYELRHHARLAVKPGITGMWQVSGRSNVTDFDEVVELDKEYICNWSMELDLKILWKTIWVVLKRDGAM